MHQNINSIWWKTSLEATICTFCNIALMKNVLKINILHHSTVGCFGQKTDIFEGFAMSKFSNLWEDFWYPWSLRVRKWPKDSSKAWGCNEISKVCTLVSWFYKVNFDMFQSCTRTNRNIKYHTWNYSKFCVDYNFWDFICHNPPLLLKFGPKNLKKLKNFNLKGLTIFSIFVVISSITQSR